MYPEVFVFISQWEVCQEGSQKGGTWRTLSDPDGRYGRQDLTLRKIPWKFRVDISIRSVSEKRVKKGVTWRMLRALDWRHGWQGHSWLVEWCSFTLRNKTWKFQVNICICCEVIIDLGVNGQLRRETRWERGERELKLTLTLPGSMAAGVQQG